MLRWLLARLVRLYQAIASARPYARARKAPPPPPPPPPPCGKRRLMRLNIVQDAFCQHLPKPRKLFRAPQAPRDATSWCDAPNAWTGRQKPRCSDCEHAHATYRAACHGDWKAECRLHRLAVRAARRLSGRRREYYAYRRERGAIRRQERLVRQRRFGVEEQQLEFPFCRCPSSGGAHHIIDRRDEERDLLRAQSRILRRIAQCAFTSKLAASNREGDSPVELVKTVVSGMLSRPKATPSIIPNSTVGTTTLAGAVPLPTG